MQEASAHLCHEEVVDRILAMRKQEDVCYAYRHYLPSDKDSRLQSHLNITWREKICQWSYNVVDHFDLSREVVAVSLGLFDRYLAACGNKCNGSMALLTSLTTLHIAIKLHDTKKIKISTLANLSRGQFGPNHIEEMEWKVLMALKWNLHPPTQYAFIAHLLQFLPKEASGSSKKDLFELSRYFTELAVCDSFFVNVNNSTVAYAAILNVIDDMSYARLSAGIRERFLRDISNKIGLHPRDADVVTSRKRLRSMFSTASPAEVLPTAMSPHRTSSEDTSTLAGGSIASTGSTISSHNHRMGSGSFERSSQCGSRARTNSIDSKGSCRYSPSPARMRCIVANVSPLASSRARISHSPMVAGVQ